MTFTTETFAEDLLAGIGAPATPSNLSFVERWANLEGGAFHNTASYNPLNTSLQVPGSVNFQTGQAGGGVQAYPDVVTGEQAAISTLQEQQYAGVVNSLRASDTQAAAQALVLSPWDAGHYNYDPSVFGGSPTVDSGSGIVNVSTGAQTVSESSSKSAPRILAAIDSALNPKGGLGILDIGKDATVIIARMAVVGTGLVLGVAGLVLLVSSVGGPVARVAAVVPSPIQPAVAATTGAATAIEATATEVA